MDKFFNHTRLGPCLVEIAFESNTGNFMWYVKARSAVRYETGSTTKRHKYNIIYSQVDNFYMLIGTNSDIESAGIIPLVTKSNKPMTENKARKKFLKATKIAGTQIKFKK
jgi:hypothetical protein